MDEQDVRRIAYQVAAESFQTLLTNSAGLRAAISDETGTGVAVFATSPTLVTPILGVATATSLTTGAPAGGTAGTWKLGIAASVNPTSPNRTIEVDIGGNDLLPERQD